MTWTEPSYVAPGEASSDHMNDEVIDNLRLLADCARVLANSPYAEVIAPGGSLGGDGSEVVVVSVNVPAQPIPVRLTARMHWVANPSSHGSRWTSRIRKTNTSGDVLAAGQNLDNAARAGFVLAGSDPWDVPAFTAVTIAFTIERIAGTGSLSHGTNGRLLVDAAPGAALFA